MLFRRRCRFSSSNDENNKSAHWGVTRGREGETLKVDSVTFSTFLFVANREFGVLSLISFYVFEVGRKRQKVDAPFHFFKQVFLLSLFSSPFLHGF